MKISRDKKNFFTLKLFKFDIFYSTHRCKYLFKNKLRKILLKSILLQFQSLKIKQLFFNTNKDECKIIVFMGNFPFSFFLISGEYL
jgi:hypothetical protein